jgi:hypothetical protein
LAGFQVSTDGRFWVSPEGGAKKIIAVGCKSELVGKAKAWKQAYISALDFEPEKAMTVGGWFVQLAGSRIGGAPTERV